MGEGVINSIGKFIVFGVNHKTAPLEIRERFYMSVDEIKLFYDYVSPQLTHDFFIVSTCNRTEFYGFIDDVEWLIYKYIKFKELIYEEFEEYSFIYRSHQAINYAFRVPCGLESKIPGDYQVLGQFKDSVNLALEKIVFSTPLERLIQVVFQACKRIKNSTTFNEGSASVSYTASQYAKKFLNENYLNCVLIIGFGEIGENTFKYLVEDKSIELILLNRSTEKIQPFSTLENVRIEGFANIESLLPKADVIIVATNSKKYLISNLDSDLYNNNKLFIDLSVPRNIDPLLDDKLNNKIVTIDSLMTEQKEVLKMREENISDVLEIITDSLEEYKLWLEYAEFSPLIKSLKNNLSRLRQAEILKIKKNKDSLTINEAELLTERINNKILVQFIHFLKNNSSEKDIQQKLKELIGN